MRGKTRNLLENVIAFVFLVFILIVIFLVIANYTSLGKSLELDIIKEEFISKLKEDKKVDDNELKLAEEEQESLVVSKNEEKVQKNNKKQNDKNIQREVTKVNTLKELEVQKEIDDKKIGFKKETPKVNETKKIEEKVTPHFPKIKKEETKSLKIESETKKDPEQKKKPVLSAKNLEKFSIINKFIRTTKKIINENVKNLNIPKTDKSRYANIRITVLKDGGYEQLTLSDGNKEYFELFSPAILDAFPLNIDERIDDQFPRYFRMKIIEEK